MARVLALALLTLATTGSAANAAPCESLPPSYAVSTGCLLELGRAGDLARHPRGQMAVSTLSERVGFEPSRSWQGPDHFKGEHTVTFHEYTRTGFRLLVAQLDSNLSVEELTVSDPAFPLPCSLRIGLTREEVVSRLGQPLPHNTAENHISYDWNSIWCEEIEGHIIHFAGHANITLKFNGEGALTSVDWDFFAD